MTSILAAFPSALPAPSMQAPTPASQLPARPEQARPFAELLRQNRAPAAAVAQPAVAPATPPSSDPPPAADAKPPAAGSNGPRNPDAAPPAARETAHVAGKSDGDGAGKSDGDGDGEPEVASNGRRPSDRDADAASAPPDAHAMPWSVDPRFVPHAAAAAGSSRDGSDNGDPSDGDTAAALRPGGRGKADRAVGAGDRGESGRGAAPSDALHVGLGKETVAERLDGLGRDGGGDAARGHDATTPAVRSETTAISGVAVGALVQAPSTGFGAAQAMTTAHLATPFGTAEFAQAFGVQISMLAGDGVQQARLHLNPAEMGPVSVHIALQGTQARIDFGADAAATRQAIEAALPELATALREAGLTLHGGGVSDHSQRRDEAPSTASANGGSRAKPGPGAAAEAAPLRRVAAVPGGIDLYA